MLFKCQTDSYLKSFKTCVKSCKRSQLKTKDSVLIGFDVILEDTILFPEGGGQPSDFGSIDGKSVVSVRRDGENAIHFVVTDNPFPPGAEVEVTLDWNKRFDNMQQHSGQHLITAVAEKTFGLVTTSWTLGEEVSYIELDAKEVTEETVRQLEAIVNEKIRSSIPISIHLFDRNDVQYEDIRSRMKLPEDQSGPIRVICIEGIDRNTCCGTHVSNLSHLQSIKLLFVQKGNKSKTNLYFLSGNRVLNYLDKCFKREKALNSCLKCTSDEFVSMINKLKKSLKISQKNGLNSIRDLAKLEAKQFLDLNPKPVYYSIHRKESDFDFITIFLNEVKHQINDTLVVLSTTDDSSDANSSGQLALAGNPRLVDRFIPIVSELMASKGHLKDGKFTAKVENMSKRSKLDEFLKSEFCQNK